jgi:hypothetical protein
MYVPISGGATVSSDDPNIHKIRRVAEATLIAMTRQRSTTFAAAMSESGSGIAKSYLRQATVAMITSSDAATAKCP